MTTTAVALRDHLKKMAPSFEKLLPAKYPVDRLITGALVAATTNPSLHKCDPTSVVTALAKIAQWGLDVGDTAHLVPYGDKCTAIADYKGLIKLMREAGARKVEAREVREGDPFEYGYGTEPFLRHVPSTSRAKPIIAAYAIVWHKSGDVQFEVMTAEEIDTLRAQHSKQWKGGELTYWYARKTVLRRIAKYVPRTPALVSATTDEGFDPETGEVIDSGGPAVATQAAEVRQIEEGDAFEDDGA